MPNKLNLIIRNLKTEKIKRPVRLIIIFIVMCNKYVCINTLPIQPTYYIDLTSILFVNTPNDGVFCHFNYLLKVKDWGFLSFVAQIR